MSLKSSAIHKLFQNHQYSTGISFLLLLLLPSMLSIDRQTNEQIVWMDSEDFLSLSRNEPLHLLLDALVVNDEEDMLLSSILHNRRKNISLVQCQSNSFFQWERFLVKSWQVLFFVVLLLPLIGMQNLLHPVLTHILRADLLEFLFHCCSNSSQTYLIHEKFWPKSEYCLCSKTKFWSQLHIYRAKKLVATSNTGPILVFPWIHPFGCDAGSSLGRVYSRQATASVNCENSAVSFVMKYCPFSTTLRNPASIQNLLNLFCCDSLSIRSPYCCNRRSWFAGSSQSKRNFCLDHTEHEWGTWLSHHNGSPRSLVKGFILFTSLCDCSVKTELGVQRQLSEK